MSLISKIENFEYHLDGTYVERVDKFNINFSSVYSDSKNPLGKRTLLALNLSKLELDLLIINLSRIANNH